MSCTFPDIAVPGETKGRSRRGLNFGKSLAWERLTKGTGSLLPSGLFTEAWRASGGRRRGRESGAQAFLLRQAGLLGVRGGPSAGVHLV